MFEGFSHMGTDQVLEDSVLWIKTNLGNWTLMFQDHGQRHTERKNLLHQTQVVSPGFNK